MRIYIEYNYGKAQKAFIEEIFELIVLSFIREMNIEGSSTLLKQKKILSIFRPVCIYCWI